MHDNIIPESELVLNEDGSVYHLHLKGENIADNVILVGDPGRVRQVASFFDSVEFQASNREFVSITGNYRNQPITVLSTGIGTDNIDIVVNELDAAINIDLLNRIPLKQRRSLNLVRIGTSGSLHSDIPVDSFVISTHGLGLDGLVYYYDYQFSDNEVSIMTSINNHLNWNLNLSTPYIVQASNKLIELLGQGMISGITVTATGFYGPQGRKLNLTLKNNQMHQLFRSFEYQGHRITNFEMETSGLYALGKMLGHQCCTCCAIIANRVNNQYSKDHKKVMDRLIQIVLDRLVGQE
jgi:uridine phosphorylase